MKRTAGVFCLAFFFTTQPLAMLHAQTVDTDGDGLLDLIDVPGFDPNASGIGRFSGRGIQDLDGANLLTNVNSLELHSNQLTSIESGDLAGLANLQTLDLAGNQLTSLESGAFEGLANLESLWLDINQITSIESGAFEGLANLESLWLYGNQLTSIESGDFAGLTNLQSLSLYDNQLTSIESGAFEGLANLQGLYLSGNQLTSIESGDFAGLTNLRTLWLYSNQITSIESGAFEGLANLHWLDLNDNQITSIESGAFAGLANLRTLELTGNQITELNLTGATFEELKQCNIRGGFCVGGNQMTSLVLDDAELSPTSFGVLVSESTSITEASLVGMTFSDENPANLRTLLSHRSLVNVLVDQELFDLYADEFTAFDAIDGKSVRIIAPGDLDRDGALTAADIDAMTVVAMSNPRDPVFDLNDDGTISFADRVIWVNELKGTYFGDANLDGEFNSVDLVNVFQAGEYEDDIAFNPGWAEGDWNGDGDFGSSDLVAAFQDGGYEEGPRENVAAVPEPGGLILLTLGLFAFLRRRSVRGLT